MSPRRRRVLAVASGGGHWMQLFRLRPAWDGADLVYVTTIPGYRDIVREDAAARGQPEPGFELIRDANRWQKVRLARLILRLLTIILRVRPDLIVTTGAAPGYLAIRLGRLVGARTIWIDSIANARELSLSGRLSRKHADICLSQWEDVAEAEGVAFEGAVL